MRKSILILACSLMASSLSAMSFSGDITIVVQDSDKVQWHEMQPEKSFPFSLTNDHFIAAPTILQDIPQVPSADVCKIKHVELWSFIFPKSYILEKQISITHQKVFRTDLPRESNSLNFTKSIPSHKNLNFQIPRFQRQV